jgi:hypothetical protein
MEKLMLKYGVGINFMMLISSLDNLTLAEIRDLDYMEDRIQIHLEYQSTDSIKAIG